MKIFRRIVFLFLLLLLLNGCYQVYRTVYVNRDGSGRYVERILMNKETFFGDESSNYNKDQLMINQANYGTEVKYVSSKKLEEMDMMGYEVEYSFADINHFRLPADIDIGKSHSANSGTNNNDMIRFLFKKGKNSELKIFQPAQPEEKPNQENELMPDEFSDEQQDAMWDMTAELIRTMKLVTSIMINGKIVSSDASYLSENKVILQELDYGEIMKDEEVLQLMKRDQTSEIDFEKLNREVPGRKIESKEEIVIRFK